MEHPIKNFILPIFAVFAIIFILVAGTKEKPAQIAYAVVTNDTWLGATNNSWSQKTNWSTGAVPGANNIAIFSASSSVNCTIDGAANVSGITIASGYGGTVTQSTGETINVGKSGFSEAGGTFTGSNTAGDTITVGSGFTQTGGIFTSTASVLSMASGTFSGGTFNNNAGVVEFDALSGATTTIKITGSETFNDLQIGDIGDNYVTLNVNIATGTVLTVNNWLFMGSSNTIANLNGGEIDVKGNIIPYNDQVPDDMFGQGSTIIKLIGTTDQLIGDVATGMTFTGSPAENFNSVYLPDLVINKASGNVDFGSMAFPDGSEGDILVGGWNNTSHTTIVPSTSSDIVFLSYQSGVDDSATSSPGPVITGSSTFDDAAIADYWPNAILNRVPSIAYTVATGTIINVQGNFTYYNGYGASILTLAGGGEIDIKGNVTNDSQNVWEGVGFIFLPTSTFNMVLNGTGTQTVGPGSLQDNTGLFLQSLNVNKASGTAQVVGGDDLTYLGGNLNIQKGEVQLAETQDLEISGTTSISAGAVLSDYAIATTTLAFGGAVTNNGLVFFDGSDNACTSPPPSDVTINSTTTGSQVPWSGSGTFVMRYLNVSDQGGSSIISVLDGTSVGGDVGANWLFPNGPEPELIQTSTASGGSGTTNLALPAFAFKPRSGDLIVVDVSARNQTITAPTDNANNTYTLVSSSTFGSSPTYFLGLYYAKNITPSSSLIITAHGGGGSGQFLSAGAFEYTGMNPSTTLDRFSANTLGAATATAITSFSATGQSTNELYFGTMTMSASTTASTGSGWTQEVGISNNNTTQAFYTEDEASSTELTVAATWTAATSTNYSAMLGIFHAPFENGYAPTGMLDSATFDTGVTSGAQLNSLIWQGTVPAGGNWGAGFPVGFQIAVSNSSAGPWNFVGPTGDGTQYFHGNAGTPIQLDSTTGGLTLFNGYRYFRYRVALFADPTYIYSPTVSQVTVNWSP